MKKLALLLLVLTLALTACGNQTIVTINVPADLEYTQSELTATIEQKSDAKYNLIAKSDGSFVIEFKESQYDKLMKDIVTKNTEAFAEVVEKYDFIDDITHNEDFTQLSMVVDEEVFMQDESNMDMAPMIVAFFNVSYQFFSGIPYEEIDFNIDFVNSETNETFETYVFSEDF